MKIEIKICLDEIDACYDRMEDGNLTKESLRNLRGWVRKQKETLKEIGYKGKIRRQPKITAKKMAKPNEPNKTDE